MPLTPYGAEQVLKHTMYVNGDDPGGSGSADQNQDDFAELKGALTTSASNGRSINQMGNDGDVVWDSGTTPETQHGGIHWSSVQTSGNQTYLEIADDVDSWTQQDNDGGITHLLLYNTNNDEVIWELEIPDGPIHFGDDYNEEITQQDGLFVVYLTT